jgi:hypothetical protein
MEDDSSESEEESPSIDDRKSRSKGSKSSVKHSKKSTSLRMEDDSNGSEEESSSIDDRKSRSKGSKSSVKHSKKSTSLRMEDDSNGSEEESSSIDDRKSRSKSSKSSVKHSKKSTSLRMEDDSNESEEESSSIDDRKSRKKGFRASDESSSASEEEFMHKENSHRNKWKSSDKKPSKYHSREKNDCSSRRYHRNSESSDRRLSIKYSGGSQKMDWGDRNCVKYSNKSTGNKKHRVNSKSPDISSSESEVDSEANEEISRSYKKSFKKTSDEANLLKVIGKIVSDASNGPDERTYKRRCKGFKPADENFRTKNFNNHVHTQYDSEGSSNGSHDGYKKHRSFIHNNQCNDHGKRSVVTNNYLCLTNPRKESLFPGMPGAFMGCDIMHHARNHQQAYQDHSYLERPVYQQLPYYGNR